jgi:hypothetical protein
MLLGSDENDVDNYVLNSASIGASIFKWNPMPDVLALH